MGYLGRWLPVVLGGVALVAVASPVLAKTPAEIYAIAEASTVKIEFGTFIGSGVIVHQQGQVYSLVTNRHVVCGDSLCKQLTAGRQYRLSLPDGQQIQVDAKNIQFLAKDLDLAVIRFTSNRSYPLAKVATPGNLKAEDDVFTAGFPEESRQFAFNQGKAIAVVNRRIAGDKGGYSIVYDAVTRSGMSGGGVFNSDGNLVAIHGLGDKYKSGTDVKDNSRINSKIGFNRGIPIRWIVQGLSEVGIIVGERTPLSAIRVASSQVPEVADEYFIIGFNKSVEPGTNVIAGKREAIQQFTKAIQLNPNYSEAYYMRAYTYNQLGDSQKALTDYDKVIALKPGYARAYNNRGILKAQKLNDPQGALADYNQAISRDPNDADAYVNRGILKAYELNDLQGALADYNQAISRNPNSIEAYVNRGNLKAYELNDLQGALADYNQAITLNLNDAIAYFNRGILKAQKLNDSQGALADFDRVISINPDDAEAYYNRGILKAQKLNDHQGAVADYDQAISLDPGYVNAYFNRGLLKENKLNDPQGALADYNQAIALKPDYVNAYVNRGLLKAQKLNDPQGALADYNRAIFLKPDLAEAYGARGLLKALQLNDRPGGIADLRQSARLARAQGNTQLLQAMLKRLNQFGATE